MTADTEHEVVREFQPENQDMKVWRYMSLPKLFSLLQTATVHLTRADVLDDPYEGSLPLGNIRLTALWAKQQLRSGELTLEEAARTLALVRRTSQREQTYVNCWHGGDHESVAMWKFYGDTEGAVVVQTTYRKLGESLADAVYMDDVSVGRPVMALVRYLDYHDEQSRIEAGSNLMGRYLYKRKEFQHEQEVRLLLWTTEGRRQKRKGTNRYMPTGIKVEVNTSTLIESIRIQPTTPSWKREVVKELLEKYALGGRLRASDLDLPPPNRAS